VGIVMTVKFDDKGISNWADYIQTKFSDKSLYDINEIDNGFDVKSKTNKTRIHFYTNKDYSTIYDCQFYNDDCKGWSGEAFYGDDETNCFNQENVNLLDSILKTPIQNGWISIDYYLGSTFFKSKTYFDKDKKSTPFIYVGTEFGCFALILFPVFWLIGKLIDIGILGHKKEITIDAINNAH
jgi:hypothetical protein